MPQPVRLRAAVNEVIDHAPGLRTLTLGPERPVPRFAPGQFLHIALEKYDPSKPWPESRVFSIASPPDHRREIRVTFSAVGPFTNRMLSLKEGDEVWIKLPYGDFLAQKPADKSTVFIAGGTGITPFISRLSSAAFAPTSPAWVLYGAREERHLIYRELLDRLSRRFDLFHWIGFVETDAPEALRAGKPVLDDALKAADETGARADTVFYISGPPGMVKYFRDGLRGAAIREDQVCIDSWE